MISSFWNLCAACPMPNEHKLDSEYSRNYTWHRAYQSPQLEVVKRAPESADAVPMEPSLSRKKKYPELAYRTHELLKTDYEAGNSSDSQDTVASHLNHHVELRDSLALDFRARSEERTTTAAKAGPRSRSADPHVGRQNARVIMTQSYPPPGRIQGNPTSTKPEAVPKATEYQSQFAWPPSSRIPSKTTAVHQPEMEPLLPARREGPVTRRMVAKEEKVAQETKRKMKKTEYKAKFRPFSTYVYVEGNWKKSSKLLKGADGEKPRIDSNAWYTEVQERLKKADEYRLRAHGNPVYGEQLPQIYSRQGGELWNQARERMNLMTFAQTTSPRVPFAEEKTSRDRQRSATVQHTPSVIPVHRKDREQDSKSESAPHPRRKERYQGGGASDIKRTASSKSGARPKSAEPATGPPVPRGESKSPRHHRRLVTTPPKLREHVSDKNVGKKEDSKAFRQATTTAVPRPKPSSKQTNHVPTIKPRPSTSPSTGATAVNGEDGRIWLKPTTVPTDNKNTKDELIGESTKSLNTEKPNELQEDNTQEPAKQQKNFPLSVVDGEVEGDGEMESKAVSYANGERRDMVRPSTLPTVNGMKEGTFNDKDVAGSSPLPEPSSGPVPLTTVRSPEEVTGVKSPDPETWTVPLETGKGLEWTDGQTPADTPVRAMSPPVIPPSKHEPTSSMRTEPLLSHSSTSQEAALREKAPGVEEIPPVQVVSSASGRSLASDVLDRARSRLDQFWSKNK